MTAIPVENIIPNPEQPRTYFDQAELELLAQSIKENTLLVPITVEKAGDEYVIIDGERRWRAVKMLGRKTIEAFIRPSTNHNGKDRLLQALIANVQRTGNTPLEEARAYKKLISQLGSQDAVALKVGVSNATVSLRLALLEFDPEIQKLFEMKRLPLDPRVVSALNSLPEEQRKRVALSAGIHGSASGTILAMCTRIMVNDQPAYRPIPRGRSKRIIVGHFDALAMGKFSMSENMTKTVKDTCANCPLYSSASESWCKQCPLVDFLRRLNREEL